MIGAVTAELTKFRTLRSTFWALAATLVASVGLGELVGASFGHSTGERADPMFASFYALTIGQLALVVFGVLAVSGEYSSGTIRASLLATPRREMFLGAKLLATGLVVVAVAVVTVLATFGAAQVGLGPKRVALGDDGVPAAIAGAVLYLVLICVFSMGVATMLRSPVLTLAVLMPVFFLGSQGLGNVPRIKAVAQFFPDQLGWVALHLTGPAGDPRFARPYGPWEGLGLLLLWAIAAQAGGYLLLRRRDA
jgi:ABC-2 type transport system permease protein